ncbi:MAG: isochorismatase family protein [Fimbriimonadaceae bacterium]|nr:isochorismatase family protein [Fimbriimonadaceae bacterium]
MKANREDALVLVVDIQPAFMGGIVDADRVRARAEFLARAAKTLEIPVFATEQYRERMGPSDAWVAECVTIPAEDKMVFSANGSDVIRKAMQATGRNQVVIVGIESHICVSQTAMDLLEDDYEVMVASDAVSARTQLAHDIAMRRLADEGVVETHTESVVYEWLHTADCPEFKAVLPLVKQFAGQ